MSLTYDDTQRKKTHEKLIEYAYYIDEVSGPFFEAVYADEQQRLKMTNDEFEAFMLKATEIKVDIMRLLTEQFQLIAKEQKNTSAEQVICLNLYNGQGYQSLARCCIC